MLLFFCSCFIFSLPLRSDRGRFSRLLFFSSLSLLLFVFFGCSDGMEREACVCDHGYERSDLCAEIIIIIIIIVSCSMYIYMDSSRVPRRHPYFILNRHTPSGESRVYRVTQLSTDGVHCRESADTGPVNLKVFPNECCLGRSLWTN